jgi:hypothetical protein
MAATLASRSAPPIVRRIGSYYLTLSAVALLVVIWVILEEGHLPLIQALYVPITGAAGIGLIREQRWAYIVSLVFAGINTLFFLVSLVFNLIWPSGLGLTVGLVLMINLAVVSPPLLLLGEPGREWFGSRELQDA